ncbi:MAG: family ATPase [Hymenobacter sp.]|nr:family ATPase [Hymenobacter sp.]
MASPAPSPLSLLESLHRLPDEYPWKSSLLLLADCLGQRLRYARDPSAGDANQSLEQLLLASAYGQELKSRGHSPLYYTGKKRSYSSQKGTWALGLGHVKACQPLHALPGTAQMVVVLALAPHLRPGFLDQLLLELLPDGGELPEFGAVRGTQSRSLLPTGDTALFLLCGTNLLAQKTVRTTVFGPDRPLARSGLLALAEVPAGEPRFSGRLVLEAHALERLLTGHAAGPRLGADFPAQRLTTKLDWNDLVLPPATRTLVEDVNHWVLHHEALRKSWGLGRHLKPGYRALFYGPPGTGKSLTATLLGKYTGREVYRVDLSQVTSKYIGETEKNLGRLFDQANAQGWILFFDEAEALFGKRTETNNAHDRFANQEVAYLLQKVEEYDGLVVLASNLKGNLDPAFARRFQAMVPFSLPTPTERLSLWQRTLPAQDRLADDLRPELLAPRYELSGAAILNVVQFAILRTLGRGPDNDQRLTLADITEGIRLEYQKEGKLL